MWILKLLAVLLLSAPLAVVGTFLLGPLWQHLEAVYGIEAVGHGIYAGWCFGATYTVFAAAGVVYLSRK